MGAKVLSLQQALEWGRGPIWLQEKGINFIHSVIYDLEHSPYLRFKICTSQKSDRHLKYRASEYGKSWRCFNAKPTAYEMNEPFDQVTVN